MAARFSECRGWRRKQLGPAGVRFPTQVPSIMLCELRPSLPIPGSLWVARSWVPFPRGHAPGSPCKGQEAWTLLVISVEVALWGGQEPKLGPSGCRQAVLKHPHRRETHHTRRGTPLGTCVTCDWLLSGSDLGDSSGDFRLPNAHCLIVLPACILRLWSVLLSAGSWVSLGVLVLPPWPSLLSTTLLSTTQQQKFISGG